MATINDKINIVLGIISNSNASDREKQYLNMLIQDIVVSGNDLIKELSGTDRSGTDRSGTDRSGTDRSGTDRSGTDEFFDLYETQVEDEWEYNQFTNGYPAYYNPVYNLDTSVSDTSVSDTFVFPESINKENIAFVLSCIIMTPFVAMLLYFYIIS